MNDIIKEDSSEEAKKLAKPIKFVGVSFLAAVIANVLLICLFQESPLVYALIPFNLAYIFCVAWLAKVAYSWFMAVITIILVIFPLGVLVIMLLAYNRASKKLKGLGYRVSFFGNLIEI